MNWCRTQAVLCLVRRELTRRPVPAWNVCQQQSRSIFGFGKKKSEEPPKELAEVALDLEEGPKYTEEEIMKMRDKSRLPGPVRAQLTGKDIPRIKFLKQIRKDKIRRYYAMWGQASGIKPGVMWPAKDELEYIKGYEKEFHPTFEKLVADLKERKAAEAKKIKDREDEVLANLKMLPQYKREFWAKYKQMHDEKAQEKAKKEKLIQEVREFVGYDLDPKDPRFEEALLKKDEEKKKELRAQRKQEKARLALERLQALANEAMEREQQDKKQTEKTEKKSIEKSSDGTGEKKEVKSSE